MRRLTQLFAIAAVLSGLAIAPAAADPTINESGTVVFTDVNPCSGEIMEVTIHYSTDVHLNHKNGGFVAITHLTGTTSDGYVMHNGGGTQQWNGHKFKDTFTDNWSHEDGSKFKAQGVFVASSEDAINVDRFRLRCL